MTLEQLRTFVAIVESGSLAGAAARLHKTKPAISIAMKRLQEELGVTLIEKETKRLELTKAGRHMLPKCRHLLRQETDLEELAKKLDEGVEDRIEIVLDTVYQNQRVYQAVIETQHAYPQVELYVSSEQRLGALQRVIDGKADIAVTPWSHGFHELGTFETHTIGEFEVLAVISKALIEQLEHKPTSSMHLHDIALLMPQSFDNGINIEEFMGVVPYSAIRTSNAEIQKQLLLRHAGWGYIPRSHITTELESGELIPLHLDDVTCSIQGEICAVRVKKLPAGPVAQLLWENLSK